MKKSKAKYYYDAAFSFAGEDRKYVEEVAGVLHQLGVKIFYDAYQQVDLWGKDLYVHLDDVYRNKSRHCVVFVSKFYKRKLWTNHERESAQARAFKTGSDYLLPVRFDDTEIPGLRPTHGYIDLRKVSPPELAYIIADKVGKGSEIKAMIRYLENHLGHYKITVQGTDLHFRSHVEKMIGANGEEDFETNFPVRLMLEMFRAGQMEGMFLIPALVPH